MSLQQDIEIHQGEAILIPLTVWSDEAKTTYKQLGGASIDYRIGTSSRLVLRITSTPTAQGSSTSVVDPTNGGALIDFKQGDTALLRPRRYIHQVIVTDVTGKPNVVTDGYLDVFETLPSA